MRADMSFQQINNEVTDSIDVFSVNADGLIPWKSYCSSHFLFSLVAL